MTTQTSLRNASANHAATNGSTVNVDDLVSAKGTGTGPADSSVPVATVTPPNAPTPATPPSTGPAAPALDMPTLMQFLGKMVTELGAAATAPLTLLGDQLGLYKAIAKAGAVTSETLAQATETNERYIREWLANQAAAGYITYDGASETFHLTPEQEAVFVEEGSPCYLGGAFYSFVSLFADQPRLVEAFRTGEGISWGNHHSCLFCGVEKFFRPTYASHLVQDWIPSIEGADEKLRAGAKAADVGCGHGASTILMAQAYPDSHFYGYDFHEPSIRAARAAAKKAGVTNVTFEVATAQDFPGSGYDFVTFFDCLHDMGDPVGAAARVNEALTDDGSWMIVEPMAGDSLEDNLNPVSRLYYAYSTQICTPSALSQDGGHSLGAQAGPKRMKAIVSEGGFGKFRKASDTPFNLIYEARK